LARALTERFIELGFNLQIRGFLIITAFNDGCAAESSIVRLSVKRLWHNAPANIHACTLFVRSGE